MKILLTILGSYFILIQSSCLSIHKGNIATNSFSIKENFNIVSTIEGNSNATYILGIGGNMRDGLVNDAKKQMYQKNKLLPNQNIANITTDIKMTYFILPLIYMSHSVTVSADVIQFYDNSDLSILNNKNISNSITEKLVDNKLENDNLSVQKSMFIDEHRIDSVLNTKNISYEIYNNVNDVKIGHIVRYVGYNNEDIIGVVIEINKNRIKMKTYPSPGQEFIIEDKFLMFSKVKF